MFKKLFPVGGLFVAVAVVLFTAAPSQAQVRSYFGGGFFNRGIYTTPVYGYRSYGYAPYFGYRYSNYYPYLGYSPYYYSYSYPYYSYYPPYGYNYGSDVGYNPVSSSSDVVVTPRYPSENYTSVRPSVIVPVADVPADTAARITVQVPANADLWFNGTKMTLTGPIREFESPPLTPGRQYVYDVEAQWTENGQPLSQTQRVNVTAGSSALVNLYPKTSYRR
jgi:uncharacterized protein (TIGR03000 family)